MTAPESKLTTDNPTLTAEEIGKRYLRLIGGLNSRADLSLDRMQEITGLKLSPAVHGGFYGAEGDLGDGWKYALNFYPASPSNLVGVQLHFVKSNERFGDMAPVCGLDFDYYHRALKAMGFMADPYVDYDHGRERLLDWRFTKFKKSDGTVDMTISIVPQNVLPGEDGRLCVKSIGTLN